VVLAVATAVVEVLRLLFRSEVALLPPSNFRLFLFYFLFNFLKL
jgi:hypothetical protein